MPDYNPFVQVLGGDVGGSAQAGPVAASAGGKASLGLPSIGAADNHWAAALVLGAIIVLWALWKSKFRFSITVGS